MKLGFSFFLALVPVALSLTLTDEVQDADPAQSGYLENHNLHPATVGSSIFGILWKKLYGVENEQWYARPLVYTPPGAKQLVFMASNKNTLRTLDAVNGKILNSRTVQPPFLASDMRCGDVPNFVGVIGTPIIDPATNTAYFFSKGYKDGASGGGVANWRYMFYAVDVQSLQDKPGFPVLIDGHYADNDHARYFLGGTILQRSSVAMLNGVVIGAFGGHCDLFNYTGILVAVSTTPRVGITSMFAMESSPGAPPVELDINRENGGKAGIWQSGMAISVDAPTNRIFIVTGNGQGHANGDVVASGRTPLSTLDEVVASFVVSPSGQLSLYDYFEPYEYISMDAGDRDLGSSGVTLLDPKTFSTSGVPRIAITGGKNFKVYIMNANNLGGFKQGIGGTDNILQAITLNAPVFGGVGSYPLEGGYIYYTPIGKASYPGRALTGKSSAVNTMTVEACYTLCAGYTYFGLEYRRECYCGNTITFGSTMSKSGATCSMTCAGNLSEICGGSSRLSMYELLSARGLSLNSVSAFNSSISDSFQSNSSLPESAPTSPTSSGSSSSSSPTPVSLPARSAPSVSPTPTAIIQGSSSIGCFSNPAKGPYSGQNLPKLFSDDSMTPDLSISSALARLSATPATTFVIAALEYGRECYVGTAAPSLMPILLTGPKACTMTYKGDGTHSCGGRNMYNLYAVTGTGSVRSTASASASP